MNANLVDISNKLDQAIISVLSDFTILAGDLLWFIVGATARDILVHHFQGVPVERATTDVDMGIQIGSWSDFHKLKQQLIDSTCFTASSSVHRLIHKTGLPLDLVPFGGIQTMEDEIEWPPKKEPKMTILGFEDALNAATKVRVFDNPKLEVLVATPSSVVFLKLISWNDSPATRTRDATDIVYIALSYSKPDSWSLFKEHPDLVDVEDFDTETAAIQILGRDISKIVSERTKTVLEEILEREIILEERSKLILEMMRSISPYSHIKPIQLLENLLLGIRVK